MYMYVNIKCTKHISKMYLVFKYISTMYLVFKYIDVFSAYHCMYAIKFHKKY